MVREGGIKTIKVDKSGDVSISRTTRTSNLGTMAMISKKTSSSLDKIAPATNQNPSTKAEDNSGSTSNNASASAYSVTTRSESRKVTSMETSELDDEDLINLDSELMNIGGPTGFDFNTL